MSIQTLSLNEIDKILQDIDYGISDKLKTNILSLLEKDDFFSYINAKGKRVRNLNQLFNEKAKEYKIQNALLYQFIKKGDLNFVVSGVGRGKTTFMIEHAFDMAQKKQNALFFTTYSENVIKRVLLRAYSNDYFNKYHKDYFHTYLSNFDQYNLKDHQFHIFINMIKRYIVNNKPAIIYLDGVTDVYFGDVPFLDKDKKVSTILSELQKIAKHYDVPIVLPVQTSSNFFENDDVLPLITDDFKPFANNFITVDKFLSNDDKSLVELSIYDCSKKLLTFTQPFTKSFLYEL